MAKELASRGWQVTATQRSPSAALAEAAKVGGIDIDTVDIDDPVAVSELAARQSGPFDLMLVNAGVGGPLHSSVDKAKADELGALFMTNAVSPIRTAKALLSCVKPGGTVAFMSSILGSVTLKQHGAMELYSASKAALNSLTRGFAATDGKEFAVLSLHPGWVKTDMGGDGADIDVATSVAGLADLFEAAAVPGHKYLDYQGKTLPW